MRFSVLGPVEIVTATARVTLPRAQHRALFALLALNVGTPTSLDTLIEALWGGLPPPTARAQVHAGIHTIRRQLGALGAEHLVASGRFGYLLAAEPGQVDAHEFDRDVRAARQAALDGDDESAIRLWRAGLGHWRGEPLADAAGAFVDAARARLTDNRLAALEDLAELRLRRGEHTAVADELAALADAHPMRERLRGHLMLALYRGGRQVEALRRYREYRDLLVEREGLDPGRELTDLERAILRADPALDIPSGGTPARDAPATAAAREVPALLPPQVPGFTGRAEELAALDRLTAQLRSTAVCALVGPGGVGKTALAVHWAHRGAQRFPDGALYADLRGHGVEEPTEPGAVLERFLFALGIPSHRVHASLEGRTGQLRTALAGRRLVIVLDNAASAAQVRPLLPGAGQSVVLVTARRRLDELQVVNGASQLQIGPLDDAAATALLRQVAGAALATAPSTQVRSLAELCGGLPLALRIAAAKLAGFPAVPLADLLAQVGDERRRLQALALDGGEVAVAASFAVSYQPLPPAAQRMFRLLALHPGPAPRLAACAATAGLPPAQAGALLGELAARHLVRVVGPDRYAMHDLLRLYARTRAEAEESDAERSAAVRRALDWYLAAAIASDYRLRPGLPRPAAIPLPAVTAPEFTGDADALDWLDAEAENLMSAVYSAAGTHPGQVWRLAVNLATWLERRAPLGDWISLNTRAVQAAADDGSLVGQAFLANGVGIAHSRRLEREPAIAAFEQARAVRESIGDLRGAALTMVNIGCLLADTGEPEAAVDTLEKALVNLSTVPGAELVQATAQLNLGYAYRMARRFPDALAMYTEALAMAEAAGDHRTVGNLNVNLAEVHHEMGEHDAAVERFTVGLRLARETRDRSVEAWALDGLGRLRRALGDVGAARTALREAAQAYESIGDPKAAQAWAALAELDRADPGGARGGAPPG